MASVASADKPAAANRHAAAAADKHQAVSGAPRHVVAVDVDEVLGSFVEAMCQFINTEYGTAWKPDDYHSYHFVDVWGGTLEDAAKKVAGFMSSSYFENLPSIAAARAILNKHKDAFKFIVVTSRNLDIADQTREWLDRHFPGCFDGVHFGNHYGKEGKKQTKGEICRSIGAIALLDDNVGYIKEASSSVGTAILFGEYRWNQLSVEDEQALPSNVVRCVNWAHVDNVLGRLRDAVKKAHKMATTAPKPADDAAHPSTSSTAAPAGISSPIVAAGHTGSQLEKESISIPRILVKPSFAIIADRTGQSVSDISNTVLSILEVQQVLTISGAGSDVTAAFEVSTSLVERGYVEVVSMMTAADSAPPGIPRQPRLTIGLKRTQKFLKDRFNTAKRDGRKEASPTAAVAGAGAASPATGGGSGQAQQATTSAAESEQRASYEDESTLLKETLDSVIASGGSAAGADAGAAATAGKQ